MQATGEAMRMILDRSPHYRPCGGDQDSTLLAAAVESTVGDVIPSSKWRVGSWWLLTDCDTQCHMGLLASVHLTSATGLAATRGRWRGRVGKR